MATTITINEVAQCLAKRTFAEAPGLSSPPASKRARGDNTDDMYMPSVLPGEGDLISPPISTQATLPGEPSSYVAKAAPGGVSAVGSIPETHNKQHPQLPQLPQMPKHFNGHYSHLHLHHHHHHHHMRFDPNNEPYPQMQPQPAQPQQQEVKAQTPQLLQSQAKQEKVEEEEEEEVDYSSEDDDEYDDDDDNLEDGEEDDAEEKDTAGDWDTKSWNSGILPALPSGMSSAEIRAAREDEACGQSIEDTYKRTLSHFPNPAIMFSSPTLEFDFRIAVNLKPESTQVHGRCHKEITAVSSGSWSGSFGNGKIMAGGYDLGQARGFRPIRIVEGAFVMQTSDDPPATLEMRTRGSLSGPCDVLDTLLSCREPKEIDCRKYGFRMFLTVKTSDKRYAEIVNCGLWVASGVWRGEQLLIDAYRVA